MNNTANTAEIEAYRDTYEIARRTWDSASIKYVNCPADHPEKQNLHLEAKAAMHWMQVARQNLNNAINGVI